VIADGQHLIARAANTDELLAEFLDVLAVGRKRNRCGCDKQREQQLADYSPPPRGGALHKKSWAVIDRPYSFGFATVGAL